MSYDIIKSIKVVNGEVVLNYACNNLDPHHFHDWVCPSLTKILQEQGQDVLDVEILGEYENGNFHKGNNNKYTRALTVLHHMPEYVQYDWRVPSREEYEENSKRRHTKEFRDLLSKAMKTMLPRDKFIISYDDGTRFLKKITSRHTFWTPVRSFSKVFRYKEDAEAVMNRLNMRGAVVEEA